MPKTWKSSPGAEVPCPKCGSLYEKSTFRLPTKDSDRFDCEVCGERLDEWNSTTVPSYRLLKAMPVSRDGEPS